MRRLAPAVGVLLLVGCATGPRMLDIPVSPGPPLEMRVLARSAVPGVPSTTTDLPATELAKDASIPGLASKLASWGYRGGTQRTFQGEYRHLTLVVSRSLAFRDHTGAETFAAFVHANASAYFGTGVEVHRLLAQSRPGWMFVPPACACHMANPAYVGVLVDGSVVTWLEINGPDATRSLLLRLLDPRHNVAAPES